MVFSGNEHLAKDKGSRVTYGRRQMKLQNNASSKSYVMSITNCYPHPTEKAHCYRI